MNRGVRGFTLIEVLLATVLLAAGLALAFATLRSASAISASGEAMAERNEAIRAAEGFLRQRLTSALPIGYARDQETGLVALFSGDARQLSFVADLPDYLGRGGPYLHRITYSDDGRLKVQFTLVQSGQSVPDSPARPPETLAEGLRALRFRYRGLDDEGKLGQWKETWTTVNRLPMQVMMQVQDAEGRDWPELVVALPQGSTAPSPVEAEL